MQFSLSSPGARLAGVVKTIWRASGTRAEFSTPEPIVPDGCVEIVFNLGDRFVDEAGQLQPRALLAGQMTRPVVAMPTGDVDLLGVRFFSGRAATALRVPMWELQDRLIDASSVVGDIDRTADDLANMPAGDRLDHLAHHLFRHICDDHQSSVVDHALALIESSDGNVAIDGVAKAVGITRRHLERRFKNEVGLGAKHIARIKRVHAALQLIERRPLWSGAEISAHCGYSDQAHLIRECKQLTGRTPARLTTTARSLAGLMREGAAARSA